MECKCDDLLHLSIISVTTKWELFGENTSTHLICETATPLFEKVQKLGGTIVTRVCLKIIFLIL